MRPVLAVVATSLVLLPQSLSATGEGAALSTEFRATLAGFRVAQGSLEGVAADGSYTYRSEMEGAGLIGFLTRWAYSGESRGRTAEDGGHRPNAYLYDAKFGDEGWAFSMEYDGDQPVEPVFTPPQADDLEEDQVPAPVEAQRGTIDPITLLAEVLRPGPARSICGRDIATFSGTRRTDLTIAPPRSADGGALTCTGTATRIGYQDDAAGTPEREWPFTMRLDLVNGTTDWQVTEVVAQLGMGQLKIERMD